MTMLRKFPVPWLLAISLMTGAAAAAAPPAPFREGINYIPVMPAQPTSVNPGQIEVIEFFWYGSPACFALQPYFAAWEHGKAGNVVVKRVPAMLNPQWEVAARAYYTAEQLAIPDKAMDAIFNASHLGHDDFTSQADFERFFTGHLGVDAKQFEAAWNSFTVDTRLAQAKVLAQRYGITAVPALVVNGKWLTGTGYKLSDAQLMNAVTWLVQQEQADLPAATQ